MTKYIRIDNAEPSDGMKRLFRACGTSEEAVRKVKAVQVIPVKKKRKRIAP